MPGQTNLKILHLTLNKKWFDMIASGEKKEEYREWKPYWAKRILQRGMKDVCAAWAGSKVNWKRYDVIRFKNGYSSSAPEMDVEFKGIELGLGSAKWGSPSGKCIKILLGEVLTIKNYN